MIAVTVGTLIFLVYPTATLARLGHNCIHDQVAVPYSGDKVIHVDYDANPDKAKSEGRILDQINTANTHAPIRIHIEYMGPVSSKVKQKAMPESIKFWEMALNVSSVSEPLRFDRSCASSFVSSSGQATCAQERLATCGDHPIPTSWLNSMKICSQCYDNDVCTGCSTAELGSGLRQTDFAIIVTEETTEACSKSESTQAYASACRWDQHDRPILSFINFCKTATAAANEQILKDTAMHEVAHALGFSAESWPRMRYHDGKTPRTTRLENGSVAKRHITCSDGKKKYLQAASASTLWRGPIPARGIQNAFKIVTPRAAIVAKAHFGCESEVGVELENQPTTAGACWGSHFEQRTLNGELMTAANGHLESVVSAFTLAVFSDMGFYEVDMSLAEPLTWGYKAGCKFLDQKCIDLEGNGPLLGKHSGYFCDTDGEALCSLDKKAKGYCEIVQWTEIPRSEFQYFQDKTKGGFFKEMDFCPIVRKYANGDCGDDTYNQGAPGSAFGEKYGVESRCIVNTLVQDGYKINGDSQERRNSCLMTSCSRNDASASITITAFQIDGSKKEVTCAANDANLAKNVDGFTGTIICPDPSILCATPIDITFTDETVPKNMSSNEDGIESDEVDINDQDVEESGSLDDSHGLRRAAIGLIHAVLWLASSVIIYRCT